MLALLAGPSRARAESTAPPAAWFAAAERATAETVFPPFELAAVDPTRGDEEPEPERVQAAGGPSRGKTILFSALVPGAGQFYAGDKTMGTVFFIGEAAAWTSFFVFRAQGDAREERYIEYAERFAGVEEASGQSDQYYADLARYDRSGEPGGPDSYNESVRFRARELYPDDRAQQEAYIRENEVTGAQAWDWESDERRFDYADIRVSSETAYHRSEYAVAGLVVGRILSVMHAIWLTADRGAPDEEGATKGAARPFIESDFALGTSRVGVCYTF